MIDHLVAAPPNPTGDYAQAVARIRQLHAASDAEINPACETQLLTHGQTVERVIVFFHGASTCPRQFEVLGERFHALGYNVVIPRLPRHGLADRMTTEMKKLRAGELVRFAGAVVDCAHGLGRHLTVVGLSAGGVLAAWVAAERADVDQAVLISPAFAPRRLPMPLIVSLASLARRLPNVFRWWNPKARETSGPNYAYPRYSTRAMIEIFWLGAYVYRQAAARPPAVARILAVTNADDPLLDFSVVDTLLERWRRHGAQAQRVTLTGLPPIHDIIDPNGRNTRIDVTYDKLLELVDNR